MNASFDEKTRELTTLALGRGLGDCGIQTRWRFDGQRFRLVRYAEEPSCDSWNGQMPGPRCGSRGSFMPGGAVAYPAYGLAVLVGRVRRSRHPATQTPLDHAQRLLHHVLNGKAEVRGTACRQGRTRRSLACRQSPL